MRASPWTAGRLWRRLADAWVTARTRRLVRSANPLCAADRCNIVAVNTPWPAVDEHDPKRRLWCCSAAHQAEFWADYTGGM